MAQKLAALPGDGQVESYLIPPDILENPDDLVEWAAESLSIQQKRK